MIDARFATVLGCGRTIRPPSGGPAKVAIARSVSLPPWMSIVDIKRRGDCLGGSQEGYVGNRIRTEEHGHTAHVRRGLFEQAQPFAAHRALEILETADIAARSRQAGDKTGAERIGDLSKYDRDRTSEPSYLRQHRRPRGHDHVRDRTDQFRRSGLFAGRIANAPAIVDAHVAAVGPAQPLQRVEERCNAHLTFAISLWVDDQHADAPRPLRLLRARRDRPSRRAAEQRDEVAAPHHSITSSARCSRNQGRLSSSFFAVAALMTNRYLEASSTGRSPGLPPLRILSM